MRVCYEKPRTREDRTQIGQVVLTKLVLLLSRSQTQIAQSLCYFFAGLERKSIALTVDKVCKECNQRILPIPCHTRRRLLHTDAAPHKHSLLMKYTKMSQKALLLQ